MSQWEIPALGYTLIHKATALLFVYTFVICSFNANSIPPERLLGVLFEALSCPKNVRQYYSLMKFWRKETKKKETGHFEPNWTRSAPFVKERQFRSSDAVTSISFLWLVVALPRESHSREICDLKINRSIKTPWQEYSGVACSFSLATVDDCYVSKMPITICILRGSLLRALWMISKRHPVVSSWSKEDTLSGRW